MNEKDRSIHSVVMNEYRKIVINNHKDKYKSWPIISGSDIINGIYGEYIIGIFKHTGNSSIVTTNVATFTSESIGFETINDNNKSKIRDKIRKNYLLDKYDYVIIAKNDGSDMINEINKMLEYHEIMIGVKKMKIFLSHKGEDKDLVRNYKYVLQELGFDVWLDEDAMVAGVPLHRSIQNGFFDSCAVVFFITDNFIDEDFLQMEINYAIDEKMKKKDKFSIITLVLSESSVIPNLLKPYVWKTPQSDLQGLNEIIKSLPIKVGTVSYK